VAGISRGVSPRRLTLVATTPVLSGDVVLTGCVAGAVGADAGARAGARAGTRVLVRVPSAVGRRTCCVRGGGVTFTGGNGLVWESGGWGAVCAMPGAGAPSQTTERSASDSARGEEADARRPRFGQDTRDTRTVNVYSVTAIVVCAPPSPPA